MSGRTLNIKTPRVFAPLLQPSRYKAAYGGRGSGKSHFFAELAVETAILKPGTRGVCIREVQKSLKDSAKLLIEDKIKALGVSDMFDLQVDQTKTPGGGQIIYRGMSDYNAETIKSLENFHWAWVEEARTLTAGSLEMLRPTIRAEGSEIWFSWNPASHTDPVDEFFRGKDQPPNSIIVRANFNDNPFFPDVLEQERAFDAVCNRDRYAHVWEGDYEPAVQGAIWDRATINAYRRDDIPELNRIVVAVDPAVSADVGSNQHGICVVASGDDGRGYVLEDASATGSPREWSNRVVALFDKWQADSIVIERNQGGDMVRHTLSTARRGLPIIEVTATRGKHVRAEPIAALYSLGKISHIGAMPELEDQMCMFTAHGYEGQGSPDRVDALVWGMTQLFPTMVRDKRGSMPTQANTNWSVFG